MCLSSFQQKISNLGESWPSLTGRGRGLARRWKRWWPARWHGRESGPTRLPGCWYSWAGGGAVQADARLGPHLCLFLSARALRQAAFLTATYKAVTKRRQECPRPFADEFCSVLF